VLQLSDSCVLFLGPMNEFPPLIGRNVVDGSRLCSTLLLTWGRGTGIHDVTGLLKKYGCDAGDVTSIARDEQGKPGTFEVSFSGLTALGRFLGEGGDSLSYRNRIFGVVNLGSQEVTVRLHWLPVYIKDSIVKQVCSRYGEVIDVVREMSQCDIFKIETGVRLVRMRLSVDEVKCLPHVVSFRCGTRSLVSVRGLPLCVSSV